MPDKESMRLGALILAGGRSRRMGRPKESLPLGDTTMLGWQCRTLLACAAPVVVIGRGAGQQLPRRKPVGHICTTNRKAQHVG